MEDSKDIRSYMTTLGVNAKKASQTLATLSNDQKNLALMNVCDCLQKRREEILYANKEDLLEAKSKAIVGPFIDRLELTDSRIDSMISEIKSVVQLTDPIGEITSLKPTPSGIKVSQMRVPLGVVGIIYESRPNVTAAAAALCLKSGNACILRGGSEAFKTNKIIATCLNEGLFSQGISKSAIQLVDTVDREAVKILLSMEGLIDVILPRGGRELVKLISEEARVPVIKHLDGICHVYLDEDSDSNKAISISLNAKTYRYGICGAMETLLVHQKIAEAVLPKLAKVFQKKRSGAPRVPTNFKVFKD